MWFEALLFAIIFYYTFSGYKSGFIKTAGSLLGLFIGVYLASRYYQVLAPAWQWLFFGSLTVAKFVVFIVIFWLVSKLAKFAVAIVDGLFDLLRFLPFTTMTNRFAGGVLGLIEGSFVAGLLVLAIVNFSFSKSLTTIVWQSDFAKQLLTFVNILSPLLSDVLIKAKRALF